MTREPPSLCVDDVIITDDLAHRGTRAPDHAMEAAALATLVEELTERPGNLLQKLCETLVDLGVADSAGISLIEDGDAGRFRWVALAGRWEQFRGGTMPFDASPCGVVIERDTMLLFEHPERVFPTAGAEPLIHEVLLVPFHAGERPIGTLWIITHDPARMFDGEDVRILKRLGRFASAAHRMNHALASATFGRAELERAVEERSQALREREQRQSFLLNLSDALRPLTDAAEIAQLAAARLGERLGVARVFYGDVCDDRLTVTCDHASGVPSIVGEHSMAAFDYAFMGEYRPGALVSVSDVAADPRLNAAARDQLRARQVAAFVDLTLFRDDRRVGILAVQHDHPRAWTPAEEGMIREVGERVHWAIERARIDAARRKSEERYRTLFESMDEAYAVVEVLKDAEGAWADFRFIEVNPAFMSHTAMPYPVGRTATELLGNPNPRWTQLYGQVLDTGTPLRVEEAEVTLGLTFDLNIFALKGQENRVAVLFSNITERKRAEEARRASEEQFRQFGHASRDILWIREAQGLQWRYLTPAFETIYGLPREAAMAGDNYRGWLDLILPADRVRAIDAIERVRRGVPVTFEYRICRPGDGAIRWLRDTVFPILDDSGAVMLIGGVGHDFTEAREAELRLKTLVEGIPQLVWRAVDGGEWTWASPQWTEYSGQRPDAYRDWGWLDAVHPEDRAAARAAWSQALLQGGFEVEYRIRRQRDGEYRWFQTRAAPVRDEAGTIIEWLGTSTDIDDLRTMHARQQVLVAELQHRTRNLIAVVRSTAEKTMRRAANLADFRERFGDRLGALARVQGLLSRLDEHDRVTFDALIRADLRAMGVLGEGCTQRVTLDGPAGVRLRSSTVQMLAMALHELATNAAKYGALHQAGGHLAIRWWLDVEGDAGEPWLHIDWRESGVAMPDPASAPTGTGQGRELIERALPYQLRARTTYVLGRDGVHCTIAIPVSVAPFAEGA
ncbi:PAS domain-containing protein [Sphingomonas carotinifaciens]|uniref:histidine kinase n=2 Tax=Sphingomonas carotinifaciens TaxID=1166323 RepID=A0A6N8LRQ1_9SPHN|nr:PAS domain-containing protein [Sphingomonas carotinifaciens]MBB4086779.1 PAS domain S-box-containing protein [Sphingomonas carotinifaciens]MWC42248.1 PAS domain-containing protein [Sphingomonas carotinifaciens]